MAYTIERKCAYCKGTMVIDKYNLDNTIYYGKLYYHDDCFVKMAEQKSTQKRGKPEMWKEALNNLITLRRDSRKFIERSLARDELTEWLFEHYDVAMVPTRFWDLTYKLEDGIYKGQRCKPIKLSTLCGCWKWGQRKLDEISQYNKSHCKGPSDDNTRLMYDLAILVGKVPQYLGDVAKMQAKRSSAIQEQQQPKVNYEALSRSKKSDDENDIVDLLDEIF